MLIRASRQNGERIIRALGLLESAKDLRPEWFEPTPNGHPDNIRVADELLVDLLFDQERRTRELEAAYERMNAFATHNTPPTGFTL